MRDGYIKLFRRIIEWEHFGEPTVLQVWLAILLNCNWQEGWFQGKKVNQGEWITSVNTLHEITSLSHNTIKRALNKLEKSGEITKESNKSYTKIRVNNFLKYNSEGSSNLDNPTDERSNEPINQVDDHNIRNIENKKVRNFDNVVAIEQLPIKGISDWFINETDSKWKEQTIRTLGLDDERQLYEFFDAFETELIAQGKLSIPSNDAKSHFVNLTRKKIKNKNYENNQRGSRRAKTVHSDPREIVDFAFKYNNAE